MPSAAPCPTLLLQMLTWDQPYADMMSVQVIFSTVCVQWC